MLVCFAVLTETVAQVTAVAVAELRVARRMVRTWVFALLAVGAPLFLYHVWSVAGTLGLGAPAPRFALPGIGVMLLWLLIVGTTFLAFDVHAREGRVRIAEVLDARPVSNIALLAGRCTGVAFAAWLSVAVLAVALQVGGLVVERLDAPAGVPAEPVSLATFVFLDAPVALLLWSAMVTLLAAALRNRLIVVFAAMALLGIHAWAVLSTPLYALPVVSGIANLGLLGSDILPRGPSGVDLAHRATMLGLAASLLAFAAAVLRRRDTHRRAAVLIGGAVLLSVAGCGFGGLIWWVVQERTERVAWRDVHRALVDEAHPDIEHLSGEVWIEPGRALTIDVELDIRMPDVGLGVLRLSLNPGLAVDSVRLDDADVEFAHALGLLTVKPQAPIPASARARLSIAARGVPDPRFAYLDSADWAMDESLRGKPLVLRGDRASLFAADYVALTPAVAWLPLAGPNAGLDDPERRALDFHKIDLRVRVPDGWHVAGPGRVVGDGWRFRPRIPLAEVALLAAPFERRALTVGEVEYELLLHPKHAASADYLSQEDYAEDVVRHIQQRLGIASHERLPYPHAVMSWVEVPAQLRRYGAGRIMDTIQALPGVQMLPEHGFPTVRFSARPPFGQFTDEQRRTNLLFEVEGRGPLGLPAVAGAPRNLLPSLAGARGDGAVAADYLLESLTAWWARGQRTVAPGHWLRSGPAPDLEFPVREMSRLLGAAAFTFGWYQFFPISLEEKSAEASFTGVDATSEEGVDILVHKGNLIAFAVQGLMGREKVGEFLALMRERHGGGTFTVDDFTAAMTSVDPAIGPYIAHYMREVALPGFLVSDVRVFRLPDDEQGAPRYQVAVNVRNDEPAPGVAGLGVTAPPTGFFQWGTFVHVPGNTSVELGVTTSGPPEEVRLETYLSKNARVSRLPIPQADAETTVAVEPLVGSRPSDWRPTDLGIVVDDLDPGFSSVDAPQEGLRSILSPRDAEDDAPVPEYYFGAPEPVWYRQGDPLTLSWGKYRRTLMRIRGGVGDGRATFAADLPTGGTWRVFYHLPGTSASAGVRWRNAGWQDDFGTYHFVLASADIRESVEYDASTAVPGWNHIGTFELPAGPARLEVSDATDGDVVVADAVRWQLATD